MPILDQMLMKYRLDSLEDKKHAIKEVVQEIVLCGLARSDFFKDAAFYGGTALRIFHGLDRFSEDLDFTLLVPDSDYDFAGYVSYVRNEVESLGLKVQILGKEKSIATNVRSAHLKGNTRELFFVFYPDEQLEMPLMHADEKIKIKFDIDTNPPSDATTELKYRLLPYPYQVRIYDLPSMFAAKLDALLNRTWKTRVKGRDYYDYVFFLSMDTPVNLGHLKARLVQSQYVDGDFALTRESLINMLNKRFDEIDFAEAIRDVTPFVSDLDKLALWNSIFFKEITKQIRTEQEVK